MSIENVGKFYVSVSKDAKLTETLEKINEKMKQKNLAPEEFDNLVNSKIIPLAKERGFDFTADELVAYSKEMVKGLSEEDLASVSGGMSPRTAAVALAFTLGSSFLAAGVVNMMSNTPTQNQAIMSSSTSNDEKKADRHAIPKLMKDENEEPNAEAKTQDISKDMQEALKDKKIVLPGQKAENSEAAPSAEEINVIENDGAAPAVRNEIKEAKESQNEEKASPAVSHKNTTNSVSSEKVEAPVAAAVQQVNAQGKKEKVAVENNENEEELGFGDLFYDYYGGNNENRDDDQVPALEMTPLSPVNAQGQEEKVAVKKNEKQNPDKKEEEKQTTNASLRTETTKKEDNEQEKENNENREINKDPALKTTPLTSSNAQGGQQISYTPFRRRFNTATSQAKHLLDTLNGIDSLAQINKESLPDLKKDLEHIATQIAIEKEETLFEKDYNLVVENNNIKAVTKKDTLVLKGQSGKIGRGVDQGGLREILDFYEQSLS